MLDEATISWADRELLETYLGKALACCLKECGLPMGCSKIDIGEVSQETLGGCTTVIVPLKVRW